MQIKYDSIDQIDEGAREHFVEWKDGDKTQFVHKDYANDLREHFRLKGDFTELKTKYEQTSSKLDELSAAEQERRRKAEQADFDDKKKNGKYDEILADWERKYGEAQEKISNLEKQRLNDKKEALVQTLASAGTESSRDKLSRLINQDLGFNDNGDIIVLDASGKATSKTVDEYKSELKNLYPELVSEVQSKGGKGKGGFDSGANGTPTMTRANFDALDHGSRAKFFKDGGKLID